ncbi:MAG TPA: YraN family protein [Anaerolineales bacterium]|nr:YraN family protein [Anaerolineales bacterium]
MTLYKKEIGAWGENVAVVWLIEHDYQIIARNVRTPYGEIDIIAKLGDVTVFIEVKTLTSSREFFPEKNITQKKQQHMLNAAQYYTAEHEIDHYQIDAIAVEGKPGTTPTLTHFENAV